MISKTYFSVGSGCANGKQTVKSIQRGGPQHIVSAFFRLGGCYEANIAPEKSRCLNKAGKNIGLYTGKNCFIEFVIGKSSIHL